MNRLGGRTIVVTGSTGIAAAAARRFVIEGAGVFVISKTEEHAGRLATALAMELGGTIGWASADLTDEAATERAIDACTTRFGRIDGLFSVAGGSGRRFGDGPIHAMTRDAWDRTLELNLTSQALVCRSVVARMRGQEPDATGSRGAILLMGSVTATDPAPEFFATHAYAAAKGAINALATTMAATYLPDRIRVNVVAPGLTATPMAQRAADDPAIRAYAARKQPLAGPMMDPDDVAHAAVYLLSDESRAVTGQVLKVDGGWSVASISPEAGS
ncbi:MAG: SDR family oxidoreductase [Chloroflexota bacterium]|nr:MAG: SDR family oxidoreductase [Chloroflexota bacterium]